MFNDSPESRGLTTKLTGGATVLVAFVIVLALVCPRASGSSFISSVEPPLPRFLGKVVSAMLLLCTFIT